MQLYDFLMIGVLCGAAVFGAVKGLAWQVASVSSVVVSYMAALRFRDSVAHYIDAEAPWNRFGAMLAIFVATSLAIWILFRLVAGTIDRVKLKEFDRQIGFLVGAAKGVLYCVLITFFVVTLWPDMREQVLHSRSGLYIARLMNRADAVMPAEVKDVLGPYLDKINQGLDPDAPPPAKSPSIAPKGEGLSGVPASIFGGTNGRDSSGFAASEFSSRALGTSGAIGANGIDGTTDTVPDARDALGDYGAGQGSAAWPPAPPATSPSEYPPAPPPRERSFYER